MNAIHEAGADDRRLRLAKLATMTNLPYRFEKAMPCLLNRYRDHHMLK